MIKLIINLISNGNQNIHSAICIQSIFSGGLIMELIRWNPRRDMFGMQHRMNRLMDDFFFPARNVDREDSLWDWNPMVDIYDKDDHIVLQAELPGVDKEQNNYFRRERSFGKFERSFTLPVNVNPEDIKADFKDGLLRVEIPKPVDSKPKQITVH